MSYAQKLRDPRWQKARLAILESAHWKCQECWSGEKELQVHHIFYLTGVEPWDYPRELLMALCMDCHKERQAVEQAIFKNIAVILRDKDIPELKNQPIYTFFA